MSIEYCFECDKHIDTDYDLEHECFDDSLQKVSRHGARSGKPEDTNDIDTKEVRKK